jgi:hypothetical protein
VIDGVEISIMEEVQSRWLAFQQGCDRHRVSAVGTRAELYDRRWAASSPSSSGAASRSTAALDPEIIFSSSTCRRDGRRITKEKMALRRAIAMAYNVDDQIRIIRKGQAVRAHYPSRRRGRTRSTLSDLDTLRSARRQRAPRAYRLQQGPGRLSPAAGRSAARHPLRLDADERDRQFDELMKRSLEAIGVRLEIQKERFPELIKLQKECRVMVHHSAWIADYPDGDNFMQLLYGPNTHESNNACYQSKEFDRRYEKSRRLPDGPSATASTTR